MRNAEFARKVVLGAAFLAIGISQINAQDRLDSIGVNARKWTQLKDIQPTEYRLEIEERNGYAIGNARETVKALVERLYNQSKSIPNSDYANFSEFLRAEVSNLNRKGTENISLTFFEGVLSGNYDCDRGCFLVSQVALMRGHVVSFVFTRDHMLLKLDGKYFANIYGLSDPKNQTALEAKYGPVCFETDDLTRASFVVYNNLALRRHRMGDDSFAIALADTAIALAPEVARLYYNRAVFKTSLGDLTGAENDLNTGLALDPADDLLFYQLYEVSMAKKDYQTAFGHLKAAMELAPNDSIYRENMSSLLREHADIFQN